MTLSVITLWLMTLITTAFGIMIRSRKALSIKISQLNDTLHNDYKYKNTQHNDTQQNNTKHYDTWYINTQHNDTQYNNTTHYDTQYINTQHNKVQHNDSQDNNP